MPTPFEWLRRLLVVGYVIAGILLLLTFMPTQ